MERRAFLQTSSLFTGLVATGALLPGAALRGLEIDAEGSSIGGEAASSSPTLDPFLAGPTLDNARVIPGALINFLVRAQDSGGAYALMEGRGRQGMEPRPHTHTHEDELVHVLEGEIWFRIGDTELTAGPGELVFMPRGIEHEFKLVTPEMRVLLLINPGAFGEYFWRFSQPATALEIPPLPTAPPSPEQLQLMGQALAEYGIIPG